MVTFVNFSSPSNPSPSISASSTPQDQSELGIVTELMMIQDGSGVLVSFYWQAADAHQIQPDDLIGRRLEEVFSPVAPTAYVERLKRVLAYQTPERFSCVFRCREHTVLFDLVMSPVILPNGTAALVVVTGERSQKIEEPRSELQAVDLPRGDIPNRYQRLLTQIAWNVRRTLELPTIWQQTVNGMGAALDVSRCMLCPYDEAQSKLEVVAEYRRDTSTSVLGDAVSLDADPFLQQALITLRPIRVSLLEESVILDSLSPQVEKKE